MHISYKVGCAILFFSIGAFVIATSQERKALRYLFLQQVNNMCTIAPMINLERLDDLRKTYGPDFCDISFNKENKALTRRQWFGEAHRYFFAWRKSLTYFMESEEGKKYLTQAMQDGIVTPNIFDKEGRCLIDNYVAQMKNPFFFVDLIKQDKAGVDEGTKFYIPIVKEKSGGDEYAERSGQKRVNIKNLVPWNCQIYNRETKDFEWIKDIKQLDESRYSSIKDAIMPADYVTFREDEQPLKFPSVGVAHERWIQGFSSYGIKGTEEKKTYMPYFLGLLKLTFLALGIDGQNERIKEGDEEYEVSKKMRDLIDEEKDINPWSSRFFSPDQFLQCAIADIFKNDSELCARAARVVDIAGIGAWQTYDAITSGQMIVYKDQNGNNPYLKERLVKYLPGREQALAYSFTQMLRLLWYGAASKNAIVYHGVILGKERMKEGYQIVNTFNLWRKNLLFSQIKKRVIGGKDGESFLGVWEKIRNELRKKRSEWVSFDGHGWAMVFDEILMKRQLEIARRAGCDAEFQKKLGFVAIESWLSNELETFYKR